jgi:hypothetical protein
VVSVPADELIFNSELDGRQIASNTALKVVGVLAEKLIKGEKE